MEILCSFRLVLEGKTGHSFYGGSSPPPLNPACPSPYKNLFPLPSFFFPGLETWQVFRETIYCYHVCALCGNDETNFVSLRYWQKHYVNNSN